MRRLALPNDFDTDSAPTPDLGNGPKVLRRESAGSTECITRAASVGAADLLAPPEARLHHGDRQGVDGRELVAA
jgi:hypothetical protein